MQYNVYVDRLGQMGYQQIIREGLDRVGFREFVDSSTRIFLKPNLTYPTFRPGVMTTIGAIEGAISVLREYTKHIYVGDADSGGYNRFSMRQVYEETGVSEVARKYGVKLVNLSEGQRKTVHFQFKRRHFDLDLPRLLTDETDFLITMPVPKIHNMTGVSLAFKNQWGCIPEPEDRLRLHPYFKHVILEVNKAVKTRFVIMDGTYGLNDNGPMLGKAVELNWLMVADDPGAAAQVACDIMQVPLESISHLSYLKKMGYIPSSEKIQLNNDIKDFQTVKFYLKRNLTDFPGFLAFNHHWLAWLAYFSPFSNMLHKLLYLVREPFYDYENYSTKKK